MAVTQKVTLYNNKFTVPPVINAVQNDTDRQVEAYFGDFTLQVGMTGKLSFIRSDGTHYEVSATLNTGANTATAELDQALTQAGVTQAQLKITDSGNVGSTFTFMIKVQPDVAGISQQQDGWSAQEFDQRLTDAENAIDAVEEDLADLQDKEYDYAPVITDTASGSIATFPDGADGYPLKECVVNIEAVQSGSGDPSPTNVRPISGWSSAKVTRTGKNLLKHRVYSGTTANIDWVIYDDGTVTFNGTANGTCVVYIANDDTNFYIPWGNYILSDDYPNKTGSWGAFLSLRKNGSYVAQDLVTTYGVGVSSKAFSTSGYDYGNVTVGIYIASGTQLNNAVFKPMIRISSDTDATYEPYLGTTFTISLGDTRYGGTLDVTRGKLRVTHVGTQLSDSDFDAWNNTNKCAFTASNSYTRRLVTMCNSLRPSGGDFTVTNGIGICTTDGRLFIHATWAESCTTLNEFKTAYNSQTPVFIVYRLATPIEVDLTPTEITTLLGINNVWADTGDIEVEYCADTKRYIQKVISALS